VADRLSERQLRRGHSTVHHLETTMHRHPIRILATFTLALAACGGSGAATPATTPDGEADAATPDAMSDVLAPAGGDATSPDVASASDAGDAARAEGGGEVGGDVGGDVSAPTDANVTPGAVPVDILRLCSFTNACSFGPVVTAPIASCIESVANYRAGLGSPLLAVPPARAQVIERLLGCAATAHGCAEFTRCGALTFTCAAPLTPCHGNVAVVCKTVGDNVPDVTDCAALGLVCDKGACISATPGAACAFASPPPSRCMGNSVVSCLYNSTNVGAEDARDCGATATCTTLGTNAYCIPNNAATCATAGQRCDGAAVVICANIGGRMLEIRQDCAAAGRQCGPGVASAQLGCQPTLGTACTATTASTCAGNNISACVNGKTVQITCADYGATTCGVATAFPICM
jgi:hypothetical protein